MMMNLDVRTPTAEIVEKLNRFSPVMLGGYPSGLELLADEQAAGRLHISPAIVMTGGELLRDEVRENWLMHSADMYKPIIPVRKAGQCVMSV